MPGSPGSVPTARRWVSRTLASWGLPDTGWAAAHVVSELATNVTLHARSAFTLTVSVDDGCVRVEVQDGSPVALQFRQYGPTATTGRGLHIVRSLSSDWGVTVHDAGKTVWALLPVEDAQDDGHRSGRGAAGGAAPPSRHGRAGADGHGRAAAGRVSTPGGLVPVHMLQMPVRVWAASQEHVDELLREFTLMTAGLEDDDSDSAPVPVRLVRLVAELTATFAGTSDVQRAQLFDAAAAGQDVIADLVYHLPPEAAPATVRLGRMLDQADDFCRDGQHLLTLATPDELVAFRRWYLGQVHDQLAGGTPVPWPDHLVASRGDLSRR